MMRRGVMFMEIVYSYKQKSTVLAISSPFFSNFFQLKVEIECD